MRVLVVSALFAACSTDPSLVVEGSLPEGTDPSALLGEAAFGVLVDPTTGEVVTVSRVDPLSGRIASSEFVVSAPATCPDCGDPTCAVATRTIDITLAQTGGADGLRYTIAPVDALNFVAPTTTPGSWTSEVGADVALSTTGVLPLCETFGYFFDVVEKDPADWVAVGGVDFGGISAIQGDVDGGPSLFGYAVFDGARFPPMSLGGVYGMSRGFVFGGDAYGEWTSVDAVEHALFLAASPWPGGGSAVGGSFVSSTSLGVHPLVQTAYGTEAFVAARAPDGSWSWAAQTLVTPPVTGFGTRILDVDAHADGSATVCGVFDGSMSIGGAPFVAEGAGDLFVAQVDATGAWMWAVASGGPGNVSSCRVDGEADGSTWVAGDFDGVLELGGDTAVGGYADLFVAHLDVAHGWDAVTQGGGGWSFGGVGELVVGPGGPWIVGSVDTASPLGGLPSVAGGFVAQLDDAADWVWSTTAGSRVSAARLLSTGELVVTGAFEGDQALGAHPLSSAGDSDAFVARIDDAGVWLGAQAGGGASTDVGEALHLMPSGGLLVAGTFQGTAAFGTHMVTQPPGTGVWVWRLPQVP